MKNEALEELIKKYEARIYDLEKSMKYKIFGNDWIAMREQATTLEKVIVDLKECEGKPDSDTSGGLHLADVGNLAKFCKEISQQEDCPAEFIDIVNKEFWNLI